MIPVKIKDVFTPEPKKVILGLIIFAFLPVILYEVTVVCETCVQPPCPPCPEPFTQYISFFGALIKWKLRFYEVVYFSILPVLGLISAYILSVITIYLWEKIPASVKRHGQENLRFSRGKLIISSIGWITTGSIFLHYLSGVYLGTSRLPLLIKGVFFINEVLEIIFFPFALLTYLLFKANGLALVTLSTITQTPLNIGGVSHPSGLTGFGAFIIIGLIIGEWYILSSLMLYLWDKIRRKFKRVNS